MNNYFEESKTLHLVNWSVVKIHGNEVTNFLQGQLTCDVTLISEQQGSMAALCNNQGRVLAVFLLFKKNNDFFAVIPSCIAEQFITHLKKFAVFSKVTLEDITPCVSVLLFAGDQIEITLESLGLTLPSQPYQVTVDGKINTCNLPVISSAFLIVASKQEASRFHGFNLETDDTYWRLLAILSGLPFLTAKTIGLYTPHMLNLPNLEAVSLNKGCYVGQEIIARTHYLGQAKRHLYLLVFNEQFEAEAGEAISANNQEVGTLISFVSLKQKSYALGILQDSAIEQALYCKGLEISEVIRTTDLEKILA